MYKKLHWHLTFLFTGIAGAILIIMSISYLYMSEKELSENNFLTFSSKVSSLITSLEQQNTLSWEWIAKTSSDQDFLLAIYDNELPISYNSIVLSEQENALANEAFVYARTRYPKLENGSDYLVVHQDFSWTSQNGGKYHASILNIRKNHGVLAGIILSSTAPFLEQIYRQRLRFLALIITGILALLLFSWIFTGKLLKPIIESRQKQTAFVAAASHELRTPIAVICSAISAARSAKEQEPDHFLEIIEEESLRISTLADDLLLLNRSDTGKLLLDRQPTELDTLLLDTYESFLPLAREHKLALTVHLPDNSIPCCNCDAERIRQTLGILITNAFNYSSANGYVKLSLSYSKSVFWIMVEDNGTGISDEDKKHIFDRFYRADKSRSDKNHFGLGLSIAKEIMDAHGGKILTADTPGGGTRFFILLGGSC